MRSGVLPLSLSKGQDDTQQPIDAQSALPQTAPIAPARSAARRLSASYQQLYRFHPPFDGTRPAAGLLDVNGTLYGTTSGGGLRANGTIYRITTSAARIRRSIGSVAAPTGSIRNHRDYST